MNSRITLTFATALLLLSDFAQAQPANSLEGCWNLTSVLIERRGARIEPFGSSPIGQLIFTAEGHMSAIQMRPDLPQGATGEPTTPGDRIVSTFIAYFGTYTLEGKELTLNIKGSTLSRWQNTTATRAVEMQTPSDLVLIGDPGDMKSTLSAKRCAAR